jgi:ParB family chromosome partitioning protein
LTVNSKYFDTSSEITSGFGTVICLKLTDIIVNKYDRVVGELDTDSYKALLESIRANGVQTPIAISPDKVVLDGHHRLKACKELDIKKIPAQVKKFDNELYEERFAIITNTIRRQMTPFQKVKLGIRLEKIDEKLGLGLASIKQHLVL